MKSLLPLARCCSARKGITQRSNKRNRSLNPPVRNGSSATLKVNSDIVKYQIWLTSLDLSCKVQVWAFHLLHMQTYLISQKDSGCQYVWGMARCTHKGFRGAKPDGLVSDGDTGGGLMWLFKSSLISLWVGLARYSAQLSHRAKQKLILSIDWIRNLTLCVSSSHFPFLHILKNGIFQDWLASW